MDVLEVETVSLLKSHHPPTYETDKKLLIIRKVFVCEREKLLGLDYHQVTV